MDLKSRSSQNLVTADSTDHVLEIVFSPDGRLLASNSKFSASRAPTRIWDVATGNLQCELECDVECATSVLAFSPDTRQLASCSERGDLRIWDTSTGSQLIVLKGHLSIASSIVFSPNGKQLASGSDDHSIRVWDTGSGSLQLTLDGEPHGLDSLAFSHSGDQLACRSADKEISIWDLVTGSRLKVFHTEIPILRLSYFAGGMYIETDTGKIEVEKLPADGATLSLTPRNEWRIVDGWLVHGGRRILWLPPDYRPSDRRSWDHRPAAQHDGLLVLGKHSDRFTFIEVDPGFTPEGELS